MKEKIVYMPGVWDLLHYGHLRALLQASKLGDKLIVGVQSDESVRQQKGHYPVVNQEYRQLALRCLPFVSKTYVYDDFDYTKHLKDCGANILALSEEYCGADRFSPAIDYLKSIGGSVVYVPYTHGISDSMIRQTIYSQLCKNEWKQIWHRVSFSDQSDEEVVGHTPEGVCALAEYFTTKLNIQPTDIVLDYGCGSGVVLKHIKCALKIGVDIAPGMIRRAIKNNPSGIFILSDHIPVLSKVDCVISYGVFHYLPSLEFADEVVKVMCAISNRIMVMEIPDADKRAEREAYRRQMGLQSYPPHLYYSREWWNVRGFETFDNEILVTKQAQFGFSAMRRK